MTVELVMSVSVSLMSNVGGLSQVKSVAECTTADEEPVAME